MYLPFRSPVPRGTRHFSRGINLTPVPPRSKTGRVHAAAVNKARCAQDTAHNLSADPASGNYVAESIPAFEPR